MASLTVEIIFGTEFRLSNLVYSTSINFNLMILMKKLLFFIILVLLLYIFRTDLLTAYARLFTVNTATQGADAMIIMSGNIATRPDYAAKLYHEGYATEVFLTREKNWNKRFSPYVEARNKYAELHLLELEVPVQFLPSIHEEGNMSTFDEVYDTVDFLKKNPSLQHLIIVTDAPHTYRTWYAFDKVFKNNGLGHIRLEMAAAPNDVFDETNWYTTEKGIIYYIEESLKTVIYWFTMSSTTLVTPR